MPPLNDHLQPGANFSPPDQPTTETVTGSTGDGTQPVDPTDRPLNPDGTTGHGQGEPSLPPSVTPQVPGGTASPGSPVPLTPPDPTADVPDPTADVDSIQDRLERIEVQGRAAAKAHAAIRGKLDLILQRLQG